VPTSALRHVSPIIRALTCGALLLALAASPGARALAANDPDVGSRLRARIAELANPDSLRPATAPRADGLQEAYARRAFAPLWSTPTGPTPQAVALLGTLAAADRYGLRPGDYRDAAAAVPGTDSPIQGADADWRARFDIALSTAVLRFVGDVHRGRVNPAAAGFHIGATRTPLDTAGVLEQLATCNDVGEVITSIEPRFFHYTLLKQALARYRLLAARPDLRLLSPPPRLSVKPGEPYADAAAVRRLLVALGDMNGDAPTADGEPRLDDALVAGLKRFQARHGLTPDGGFGRATYAAMTVPLAVRVRQIELSLERWRWLPPFDSPPIIVNIPQYRLFAFQSTTDRAAGLLQMDVIVGKAFPQTRTPVFTEDMRFVIFRPYWDVPRSITEREELPRIRSNPAYLEKQQLEIVAGPEDAAKALPPTAENLDALAAGRLRLRQRPGPDNALGLVKFMLPNAYNVYLHSTPVHRLFGESRRAFSHGCIRVSDPVALAAYVLRDAPGDWTPAAIEAAMNGAQPQRVNLAKPIRVMILYTTALATEAGPVLFFDDIYGYDRKLERLLGLAPVGAS